MTRASDLSSDERERELAASRDDDFVTKRARVITPRNISKRSRASNLVRTLAVARLAQISNPTHDVVVARLLHLEKSHAKTRGGEHRNVELEVDRRLDPRFVIVQGVGEDDLGVELKLFVTGELFNLSIEGIAPRERTWPYPR